MSHITRQRKDDLVFPMDFVTEELDPLKARVKFLTTTGKWVPSRTEVAEAEWRRVMAVAKAYGSKVNSRQFAAVTANELAALVADCYQDSAVVVKFEHVNEYGVRIFGFAYRGREVARAFLTLNKVPRYEVYGLGPTGETVKCVGTADDMLMATSFAVDWIYQAFPAAIRVSVPEIGSPEVAEFEEV